MYRISTIALIATTAILSGCADKSEAPKQEFVEVFEMARKSQLINQIDVQLGKVAKKLGNNGGILGPQGDDEDRKVGQTAQAALVAYFGIPQKSDHVTEMIASARHLYAKDVAAFDQAVEGIKSADSKFPNYSVYEFVRANVEILTNDLFDINTETARVGIQKALACAADKGKCGVVSPTTLELLSVKDKILSLVSLRGNTLVSDIKLVFLPFYVFVNHSSIPIEFREMLISLIRSLANLAEAIKADPESAEGIFRDLEARLQPTPEERLMLASIERHVATIARAFR